MKNRLYWILGLIDGILMMIAGFVIPVYKTMNIGMIGGADWPTFTFYFQETAILFFGGAVITLLCAMTLKRKKQ